MAPAPVNQGAPAPKGKGIAKAKGLQAAHDGYLRVQASVVDTCLTFVPFRGVAWEAPAVPGGFVATLGANNWAQIEAAAVIASVAAYETPNPSPWVFALQVVLCICGFLIPTKVTLVADGNWPAPTHNYNFVTGTNHLGLDTSADGDAAVRDFWMKMGDLLCCWCSVRGGRDSIPTVGSSRNEKHQKRGSWDFRWTERLKHRCRSIFGRTLTTSICKAWPSCFTIRLAQRFGNCQTVILQS